MNAGIEQMLEAYDIRDLYDRKNAMKEIMQEIVLCGLSRANFFQEAAFYGGTALRIFYGLDRFFRYCQEQLTNFSQGNECSRSRGNGVIELSTFHHRRKPTV